ncbi:hypothetical protein BDY19DRAFT_179659 [Irpex rosettiformis]|uniref:Uncharacterized protein n=1 Tax=Irpex rosettiformis TaxID=378272 RepID=A0ACB8U396_9APHY|nr:hypothetical protein BDY19DRAFT_179659 [Irpex rosettiformis]
MEPVGVTLPHTVPSYVGKAKSFHNSRRSTIYDSLRGFTFVVSGKGGFVRGTMKSVQQMMLEINDTLSAVLPGGTHYYAAGLADYRLSQPNGTHPQQTIPTAMQQTPFQVQLISAYHPPNNRHTITPSPTVILQQSAVDQTGIDQSSACQPVASIEPQTGGTEETKAKEDEYKSPAILATQWIKYDREYREYKATLGLMKDWQLGSTRAGRVLCELIERLLLDVKELREFSYRTTQALLRTTPSSSYPKSSLFPVHEV